MQLYSFRYKCREHNRSKVRAYFLEIVAKLALSRRQGNRLFFSLNMFTISSLLPFLKRESDIKERLCHYYHYISYNYFSLRGLVVHVPGCGHIGKSSTSTA